MEYQRRIDQSYQILPAYSYLTGTPLEEIRDLADALVDKPKNPAGKACGKSGLNADQSPLQLCISSSKNKIQCRLIADPASDESAPEWRYARSRLALTQILTRTGSHDNAATISTLLKNFGPGPAVPADLFGCGVFWLGASVEHPGLAIYTDTSVHETDVAWDHALRCIDELSPDTAAPFNTIEHIRAHCWLSSIGIEGSTPDNSRIKLYARMHTLLPGGILGELFPALHHLTRSGCFSAIMGQKGLSYDDVLLNFGFHLASGKVEDIKVDISASALQMDGPELAVTVDRCCDELGLRAVPVSALFERYNLAPSFIGAAITADGQTRLNVYLKGGPL